MSKKLLNIFIFSIFAFSFLFLTTSQVSAASCNVKGTLYPDAGINECVTMGGTMVGGTMVKNRYFGKPGDNIGQYINAIYKYGIGIVGILATIVIMVGGLIWITSMGNAARVSNAKDWIGSALTGLALAMFSYTLLFIINPDLVKFQGVDPKKVDANINQDAVSYYSKDYCKTSTNYRVCGEAGETTLCFNKECVQCVPPGGSCTQAPCCNGSSACVDGNCWSEQCLQLPQYAGCLPRIGGLGYCNGDKTCVNKYQGGHDCSNNNQCLSNQCATPDTTSSTGYVCNRL